MPASGSDDIAHGGFESGSSLREKLFSRGECVGIERRGDTRLDRTRHPRPGRSQRSLRSCSLARVASAARKRRACSDASRMRESVSRALRSADSSAKMAVARSRRTRRRGPKAEAADPLAAEAATQHCPESDGCGRGRPIQRGLVIAGWVMVRGHAESSRKEPSMTRRRRCCTPVSATQRDADRTSPGHPH